MSRSDEGVSSRGGYVSPEEQAIIDNAKANGTYLLAPNGRPTNLTPRQWVQVRTEAFKQWFGDWLKAARINKLRTSKDAVITGEEISASKDLKEYKKNALEYGKSLRGQYVNADTGQTISMGKSGIKEVLNHDYKNVEQLQSIAAIPQIIENAIYIDSAENEDTSKNKDVSRYHYYVCGLKIGNTDYTVRAVVAEQPNGERYYDHKLTQIEKGTLLDSLSGITTPGFNQETFPVSMGKDSKLLSILQTNASKIVDENGEPRIMYHGTDVDITTFLMQDGSLGRGAYFTSNWDEAAEYAKEKQGVEDIEDLDESKVLEVFLNVRDENNITHSRFYRGDIEVLATTPNQIKSATDNIGTFDNRLNDIRFRNSSSASRSDDSRGGSQLDGVVDTLPDSIRDKFSFREIDDTTNSSSNSNWSPEEQSIIDNAKANGTYLLAPNGRPTNLTPRQWVQVRTEAFKQWFGDWEKQAQKTFLTTHKPVSTLTGDEFATKQGVKLTDQVEKYFATIGGKATSPVYGVVILDRNGADDSLAHGMGRNKAIAYAAVKDVIENGILIDYDTNHKGRGYDSAVIAAPIEISGERYICYVTIKRNKKENRYYLHEVWAQKSLTNVRSNAAQKQPSHLQGTAKVLQNILTASDNASKIVDENGEPRIMYHGTDVDITTFLMQDGSLGRGAYFTSTR